MPIDEDESHFFLNFCFNGKIYGAKKWMCMLIKGIPTHTQKKTSNINSAYVPNECAGTQKVSLEQKRNF